MNRPDPSGSVASSTMRRLSVLLLFVGMMWVVRIADSLRADGHSIAGTGVIPRSSGHFLGFLTAPFIHANWPHLVANTVPLLILGSLVLLSGVADFIFVTLTSALIAGAGTWMFGSNANHIGASGVVFGYIGFLLVRPFFDRRVASLVITLVVGSLYGAMLLTSAIPQAGISWTAHFFGFCGGIVAASMSRPPSSSAR